MRTKALLQGRGQELKLLTERAASKKSELIAIYGRRRIGKSTLIVSFSKDYSHLLFEGLEGLDSKSQIAHFVKQLKSQINDNLLQKAIFDSWNEVFDYLTTYIKAQKKRIIISFDEFQWMAAGQAKLISLLKYYWDNQWKNTQLMLILCGSVASFMVKKVLRSNALYGRFTAELQIQKLNLHDIKLFFPAAKSYDEILRYALIFGGVPKYIEDINPKLSFEQNLEKLIYGKNALFREEFDKIFNVHFKEPQNYLKIIKGLQKTSLNLDEISKLLQMKSSGGVKTYVENLELAGFIRPIYNYSSPTSRYPRYKIADEFLQFYIHFIMPNLKVFRSEDSSLFFKNKINKQLPTWLGLSFENYFTNNAMYFAKVMGFSESVESYGPYFNKGQAVQVDLVYYRSDRTISVCEMKFKEGLVSTEIIPEMETKIKKLPITKTQSVHKILIAPNGVSKALRDSEYFDIILTAIELFVLV
jgi:AAA+ ATPase superfamily predicted ATPase